MAAVVCRGISNCCSAVGELVGFIAYPCRNVSCEVLTSPFFTYITFTCALNIPVMIWGLKTFGGQNYRACSNKTWLQVESVLAMLHIAASFYVAYKVNLDYKATKSEGKSDSSGQMIVIGYTMERNEDTLIPVNTGTENKSASQDYVNMEGGNKIMVSRPSPLNSKRSLNFLARVFTRVRAGTASESVDNEAANSASEIEMSLPNSFQRLSYVLFYDEGVAVYILVLIFWIIWQTVGIHHLIHHDYANNAYCSKVEHWTMLSVVLAIVYGMLSCVAFSCSLSCLRL